jgi:hypothetical protein
MELDSFPLASSDLRLDYALANLRQASRSALVTGDGASYSLVTAPDIVICASGRILQRLEWNQGTCGARDLFAIRKAGQLFALEDAWSVLGFPQPPVGPPNGGIPGRAERPLRNSGPVVFESFVNEPS